MGVLKPELPGNPATYYCNKCGYLGVFAGRHLLPNQGSALACEYEPTKCSDAMYTADQYFGLRDRADASIESLQTRLELVEASMNWRAARIKALEDALRAIIDAPSETLEHLAREKAEKLLEPKT